VPNRIAVSRRLPRRTRSRSRAAPRIVVLGDLTLDVVIRPGRSLASGTDVPGTVRLRQGGSAANTAGWLGRLGASTQLICAVGRDGPGRALIGALRSEHVVVRASRVAGKPTARIGVIVAGDGERSFVADRGAADWLSPGDLDPAWFNGADLLHLPAYSLLGEPLGSAGREAIRLARAAGAAISLDLASVGPLMADGREAALGLVRSVRPDVLLATATELAALLGSPVDGRLHAGSSESAPASLAPLVVIKRGASGAAVHGFDGGGGPITFEVATKPIQATDSTGAGDAFDAGFLLGYLAERRSAGPTGGVPTAAGLRRAVMAGHRAAARQLTGPYAQLELDLG
jgi:ribokinase